MDHDGRLTREEFAVVMYLIRSKLAGREIPDTLPPSLVPPADLPSIPVQEVASTTQGVSQPAVVIAAAQATPDPPPPYEEPNISSIRDEPQAGAA